jgi:hypothetical protein
MGLYGGDGKEGCLRLKLGSCVGCNGPEMVIGSVRWRGKSPEEKIAYLKESFCPAGEVPSLDHVINNGASWGFGQRRRENLKGLRDIRPPRSSRS